jgi:hypothetical protein
LTVLDSHEIRNLIENRMSKIPPNLGNFPPDMQAYITAQAADLARKDFRFWVSPSPTGPHKSGLRQRPRQ